VILPQNQSGVVRKPACRRTPNFFARLADRYRDRYRYRDRCALFINARALPFLKNQRFWLTYDFYTLTVSSERTFADIG
ncbi:MAG TPA: hypothetical protein P5244_08630, partial [Syntrophales bacterium]|nr:hypothetical protein [Syntrophales bacterium]